MEVSEQLSAILQRINETNEGLHEILIWRARLDEQIGNFANMLHGVRQTVYGNPDGQSGLTSRIQRLENGRLNTETQQKKLYDFVRPVLQKLIEMAAIAAVLWIVMK